MNHRRLKHLAKLLRSALYHVIWTEFAEQQTTTAPMLFCLVFIEVSLNTKETSYITQPQLSAHNFLFGVKQAHVLKLQGIFGRQKVPGC